MYDILQLNDMLVPELLDIAEQQNIPNCETLEKQELIYKILDNQSTMTPTDKKETPLEKPKRKRIAKPVAKKETPEKEKAVEEDIAEEKETKPKKIVEKKKIVIKPKEKVSEDEIDLDEYEDIEDGHEHLADPKTIAPALLELLKEEDSAVEEDLTMVPPSNGHQHHQSSRAPAGSDKARYKKLFYCARCGPKCLQG